MEVREPSPAYANRRYTIAEYLEIENAATEKHEYYRGEIFAMSGAKMRHNHIVSNLFTGLGVRLAGSGCKPFGSDTRVHIPGNTLFTYPDITVICGREQTLNDDDFNVLNPTALFEVLSPTTRDYDLGAKFMLYKAIPSLRMYVTVDPDNISVSVWTRNVNATWKETVYTNTTDTVELTALDIKMSMDEIYNTPLR